MKKRLRKKLWKKSTPEEYQHCMNCNEKLYYENNYHREWGTCDWLCYMKYVGLSPGDFI